MNTSVAFLYLLLTFAPIIVAQQAGTGGLLTSGIPAQSEVIQLSVSDIKSGWWLRIRPDGSGYLDYGESPADGARIAPGKLNFPAAYNTTARLVSREPEGSHCFAVAFPRADEIRVMSYYLNDATVAAELFASALRHATPYEAESFKRILQSKPVPTRLSTSQTANPAFSMDFAPQSQSFPGKNPSVNNSDTARRSDAETTDSVPGTGLVFWRTSRWSFGFVATASVIVATILARWYRRKTKSN